MTDNESDKHPDDAVSEQERRLDEAFGELERGEETSPRTGSVTGPLAMLLALIALGVASYATWMLVMQPGDTTAATQAALESQLAGVNQRLQQAETELQQVKASAAATPRINVDELVARDEFDARLQEVIDRTEVSGDDWVLAEVIYLVRMANQRVLVERETGTALRLLQSADEIVAAAEGLTAHNLRQALALDIAALEAVADIDRQGIYLRLAGLVSQVNMLQLPTPVFAREDDGPFVPTPAATWLQRIGAFFMDVGRRLASLVDYRRGQVDIKPILPPQQEYYLRQNLIMKLQIAQLAVLNEDQTVYEQSLGEAREWLAQFDGEDSLTAKYDDSLAVLIGLDVATELPDISASLREARALSRAGGKGVQ